MGTVDKANGEAYGKKSEGEGRVPGKVVKCLGVAFGVLHIVVLYLVMFVNCNVLR